MFKILFSDKNEIKESSFRATIIIKGELELKPFMKLVAMIDNFAQEMATIMKLPFILWHLNMVADLLNYIMNPFSAYLE